MLFYLIGAFVLLSSAQDLKTFLLGGVFKMSSLSDLLQNYPVSPPPPGVKSNFNNPETLGATLIRINVVFITLMLVMVAVRIYSKARITRTLWWDDCGWLSQLRNTRLSTDRRLRRVYSCGSGFDSSYSHDAVKYAQTPASTFEYLLTRP